jgi:hypothetical protein
MTTAVGIFPLPYADIQTRMALMVFRPVGARMAPAAIAAPTASFAGLTRESITLDARVKPGHD